MILLNLTTQRLQGYRLVVCLLLASAFASPLQAESPLAVKSLAAEILPETVVAIAELSDFGSVIQKVLNIHFERASSRCRLSKHL